MIHVLSVAEFMYHDAVDHLIRQQHEQAIEIQIAFAGAAAPAGALVADGDPSVIYTGERRTNNHSGRSDFDGNSSSVTAVAWLCFFPWKHG